MVKSPRWTPRCALALCLSACGSSPSVVYTPQDFCGQPVGTGMARIVVQRASGFGGGALTMLVLDDDQPIGRLGNGGRLCWDRHPGTAHLAAYASAGAAEARTVKGLHIQVKAGQTVTTEVSMADPWKLLAPVSPRVGPNPRAP